MMDTDNLWTARELASFLVYTESTVKRMVTDEPDKLPPRVECLGRPRWHPEIVRKWAFAESTSKENDGPGRKREIK